MIKQEDIIATLTKKLELKHLCWDQIYVIILMHILLWKEILLSLIQMVQKEKKSVAFKNNAPFLNCISKINGVQINNAEDLDVITPMHNLLEYTKITKKQQVVFGIITEMNQVIFFHLILNFLKTRRVLQEVLMMVMMMQKKLVKMTLKLLYH